LLFCGRFQPVADKPPPPPKPGVLFGQAVPGGVTLPSGQYLNQPPQYFPPDSPVPLPRELNSTEAAPAAGPEVAPMPRPAAEVAPMPRPAGRRAAADPPSDRDVLRALPKRMRGVPHVEETHDDVVIVKNRLADRPRWECAVYYTETIRLAWPVPLTVSRPRVQVVHLEGEASEK
jgi:hypothetical protein